MHILVTGFEPFEQNEINPSWEAVKLLDDTLGPHTITKRQLPTSFVESEKVLDHLIEPEHYDAIVAIGQAGGRYAITPERIGINLDDARIPDNSGNQPSDKTIKLDGANAYFSNLPVKAMTQAIRAAGLPSQLSNSAGTFVCNHVFYYLGYLQATKYPWLRFGFIHVPYLSQQIIEKPDTPAMSLDDIVKGLTAALQVIHHDEHHHLALGTTE
ncbi:pyroglutamyl-peptidase I [Staphylococcus simiae]|uniref:Pyrrolidone-carboxylate peptidase n=1 Tax=Staphylococcus simiae CCM 7213 = CCUG 51256 TaxID=911238 RepID=G5JJY6_9STAP|nr:pyroglutamyl-peptidase I [Staphylococcus simiae]EHJ07476.1 pyrrolidone-carboxylate peptidase [Staphylococcus simiae CCM 7213 = CCUG 51256]PNZ14975.1 pyroglutamyl-peptidase I [Staphylococcus simiae]SNV84774.1 Pyrrolidone-carboxylate peptidase [Staphylococcus simiae]